MEILPITLAAGETKNFYKAGRYFEIIDSTAAIRVDFYSQDGKQSDQMVNALSGLFLESEYDQFTVFSATAQTISVLLMETGRGGSRRQPGVVSVIDSAKSRSVSNLAFVGYTSIAAVAAQLATIQLFNPAGSGKRLIVESIKASSSTTQNCSVGFFNVAAVGLNGVGPANKQSGSAASTSQLRLETSAAYSPLANIETFAVAAVQTTQIKYVEPLIVLPGFGLNIYARSVNTDLFASFEFFEETL